MKFRPGAVCATIALAVMLPAAVEAQSTDAYVLPFGTLRLGIEGVQATHVEEFDASGNRVDVGAGIGGELGPSRFVAIQPLAGLLGEFLEATAGGAGASAAPPDPQSISLGLLDVAASTARTDALARVAIGILPRLEMGAALGITRGNRMLHRLALAGGNLGVNPDIAANRELLATIGWGPLGDSPLLPTAESPLGIELQNRVSGLTGQPLTLPQEAAGIDQIQSLLAEVYDVPTLESGVDRWRISDLEVSGRALLLSTFGAAPVPLNPQGLHLRVALSAGARFPTGEEPDTLRLLALEPAQGLSTLTAGGALDLFLGSKLWLTGAARLTWNREMEVIRRIAPRDAPLSVVAAPAAVTYRPGNTTEIRISPRYRLAEAISLGAEYVMMSIGDREYSGGGDGVDAAVLNLEGGSLQRIGVGMRYSSLPAHWVGRADFPAEVTLGYSRTISGPEGFPAGGMVTVSASVLPRLW